MQVEEINLQNCRLRGVTSQDALFIKNLFSVPDVRKYYVLREDHALDINLFVGYLLEGHGLNYVIEDKNGAKVGIINTEAIRDQNNNVVWHIAFAVHPNFRSMGFATTALNALSDHLFQNFPMVQQHMLDISKDNVASEAVARKCGYEILLSPTGGRVGFVDQDHPELGIRFRWYKSRIDKRAEYFYQASQVYQQKNYTLALDLYRKALEEPYTEDTPFTDAQIYSNIGMAYSCLCMYGKAFEYLKKAQSLGLTNPSIERELLWLKNNAGLY